MRCKDRTGSRNGRLLVIKWAGKHGRFNKWLCKCDCGREVTVWGTALASKKPRSCGCARKKYTDEQLRLKSIWRGMIARCNNKRSEAYRGYGQRGISVCERWRLSFVDFCSDMGKRPGNASIDRINNDGNYEPGNCRWAAPIEQGRNTRRNVKITYNGITACLSDWAIRLGRSRQILWWRLRQGWTLDRVLI